METEDWEAEGGRVLIVCEHCGRLVPVEHECKEKE